MLAGQTRSVGPLKVHLHPTLKLLRIDNNS